jgi:hypothetical protein
LDLQVGDEFREALSKRMVPSLRGDAWRVCKAGYLIEGWGEDRYLVPAHDIRLESKWRVVNLLEEPNLVPDLIKAYRNGLERCTQQSPELSEFEEPILEFVGRYGLGITGDFRWAGGREETLRVYLEVMQFVEPLVGVLEALLSGEEAAVDAALKECFAARRFIAGGEDFDKYFRDDGTLYFGSADFVRRGHDGEVYELDVTEHALSGLGYVISYWYYRLCFPFAIPEPHARRLDQMDVGWGFSNLTGAVFWRLFQFLGAQSRIAQCMYCGNLIPNAHKNTKFCRNDKECSNAYYYEHVTKPERERHNTKK